MKLQNETHSHDKGASSEGGETGLGTLKARLQFLSGLASFPSGTHIIFVVPNSIGVQLDPLVFCLLYWC